MRSLFIITLLICPLVVQAAVQITEIAWMGSDDSANHEWIELYNDGSAVIVDGWTLTDGSNLSIELQGTVPAGGYAVLERTSDGSAPGAAFLIYTGALVNTGATLTLRDNVNQIVDQVVGGADWDNVGGNNDTKETAQKGSSGWVTGVATPGASSGDVVSKTESSTQTTAQTSNVTIAATQSTSNSSNTGSNRGNSTPIRLTLPDVTLQLALEAPVFTYVNQPVELAVTPSGIGDTLIDSLEYMWNFGDGNTASGASVSHTFAHPGRYVVVVEGAYKRQRQLSRIEIDVLPVNLEMSLVDGGNVRVENIGDTEIDLGGYHVRGQQSVILPRYSIVLPGQAVHVPIERLTDIASDRTMFALYDQTGHVAAMIVPAQSAVGATVKTRQWADVEQIINQPLSAVSVPALSGGVDLVTSDTSPAPMSVSPFGFADKYERSKREGQLVTSRFTNQAEAADLGLDVDSPASHAELRNWPFYALFGLLMLGVLGIYLSPVRSRVD